MYYLVLFLVLIGLMCGCRVPLPMSSPALLAGGRGAGGQGSMGANSPTHPLTHSPAHPLSVIHVFLFAGFRQLEIEQKILDEVATDDSPFYNAPVLRYEITDSQHIAKLVELDFIGSIYWKVPEVAYSYHIICHALPTDGVLDALAEWARETTEFRGSVVSVQADTKVLRMIQRISDISPVVM